MASAFTHRYGEHAQQFMRVHVPDAGRFDSSGRRVALIVHGGFWKACWTIDNAAHMSLAPSLAAAG